jgi:hypothetical protein
MTHESGMMPSGIITSVSPTILIGAIAGLVLIVLLLWKFKGSSSKGHRSKKSGITGTLKKYAIYGFILLAILAALHVLAVSG